MGRLDLPRLSGRVDGLDWLIVAAAALGAALVMARVLPYGAGVNSDSLRYLDTAINVLAGEGFVNLDGTIFVLWPPGYPILLAAASLGIVDPYSVAGILNAVLFGLTILAVGLYLRRRLETRFLALWACLAIALSLPLADLARFAWSETSFILFTTLALIQTDRALRNDSRSALAWVAVLCALAWLTRYLGVVVPVLTGLALLLQGGMPLSRRVRRTALFGAIAGAPPALWILRNYIATGMLRATGAESPSLSEILRDTAQIMASWLQPLPGWLAVIVLAALILSLFISMARGGGSPSGRRACLIFGGFALAYVALLSVTLMLGSAWGGVRTRYIAVLYIPLIVVATFALDGLFGWARDRRTAGSAGGPPMISAFARGRRANRLAAVSLGVALCAWIAAQAVDNADHIARANSGELILGRAGPGWAENETMRYLRENLSGAVIYTNSPETANFLSGRNADYRELRYIAPSRDEFMRWVAINEGAYVVWINDHNVEWFKFSPINLRVREGLEPIAEFADGMVFRVNGEYKPDPDTSPYFGAYSAVARGEDARLSSGANFEVHVHQDTLIYFKRPCAAADVQARFFLHIFPENAAGLPDDLTGKEFENLDFEFKWRGALFDGNCVAVAPLPRYEYERILTGQYAIGERALWKAEVAGTAGLPYREAHNAAMDGEYGGAVARSNFDIYLDAGESKALIYVKEPCAPQDTRARFFLHVFPDDAADLPADGARRRFDNLDFRFAEYGANLGGICVAMRELPEYEVERVRTGQYVSGAGALWEADVAVSAARRYRQAYNAAIAGEYGGAVARSSFDVYLNDDGEGKALIYVKEECAAEDVGARFFLHIVPEDGADLPDERKPSGFDNMDFGFAGYGANLGEVCVAVRELPRYEIESVRTGQYVSGDGALWRVEFGVDGGE